MANMLGKQFVFMLMTLLFFVSTTHARSIPSEFRKKVTRKENVAFSTINSENQQPTQPLFYQQTQNYNPHGVFPTQSPPPSVPSTFNPYPQVPSTPPQLTVQEQYQQFASRETPTTEQDDQSTKNYPTQFQQQNYGRSAYQPQQQKFNDVDPEESAATKEAEVVDTKPTHQNYYFTSTNQQQQQQEYFNNQHFPNENEEKPPKQSSYEDSNNPFVFKDDEALNAYLNSASKEEEQTTTATNKKSYIDAEELEKIFAEDDDDDDEVAEKEEEEEEENQQQQQEQEREGMSDTRFMNQGMYNFDTRTNQFTSQSHPYNQQTKTNTKKDAYYWMNYYQAAPKSAMVGDSLANTKYYTNSQANTDNP